MISAIKGWVRSTVDVRRDEYGPVALMFAYGFLAITSYYVIKPARNSIFVDRVGADQLPWVYIATAVVVLVVMVGYSKYVDRVDHLTLILSSMGALAASLVGFWWLLTRHSGFVSSGAFYVFTKLYPLFLVSQFWLVANVLFTTTQARRLFGFIGIGLILGGIAGSSISGFAADHLGTEPLLLAAVGVLVLCSVVVVILSPRIREGAGEASGKLAEDVSGGAVKLLLGSSHLKTIAAVLGLTVVVGTLLDWQLNRAVELFIDGEDAKTEFFGRFYATLNVASVVVQALLTGYVLRRFGVGLAILILPLSLGVLSSAVLLFPMLWVVAVAKGSEGALRYSLDQSTRELLFLPVPTAMKTKVKPLIDLTVYRVGTGLGGVLLLVFVNGLGVSLRWISVVTLAAIAVWLVAAWRMRTEFARSLRRLIGVRDVRLEELLVRELGAEVVEEIDQVLREGTEDQIRYALALLEQAPDVRCTEALVDLLAHDSEEIRRKAVTLLTEVEAEGAEEAIKERLHDDALSVRVEAIRYLCEVSEGDPVEVIQELLSDEAPEVRVGAIGCMIRHGDSGQRNEGMERIRELAEHDEPTRRRAAAELLGQLDPLPEGGAALLEELVQDPDASVCHTAMRAIGRAQLIDLVPLLLDRLADSAYRPEANDALAAFGERIQGRLLDFMVDETRSLDGRMQIPALLVPSAGQETLERLWDGLDACPRRLRYHALKAVNKLRRDRDDLDFGPLEPESLVRMELDEAAHRFVLHHRSEEEGADELLRALLIQRFEEAAERAVRALAVRLDQGDLYAAFTALTSARDVDRQRGFELLDALLPQRYRPLFDPLMNPDVAPEKKSFTVLEAFDLEIEAWEAELESLADGTDDPWLELLARRAGKRSGVPEVATTDRLAAVLRKDAQLTEVLKLPKNEEELMDVLDRGEVLRKAKIFSSLSVEDLAALGAIAEEETFTRDEVVFEEGAAGQELFVVMEGKVRASKDGRILFEAGRGRSVGSLSLLDGLPTDYEAVAVEDTVALRLERPAFITLLENRSAAVVSVMEYLTGVVRGLNEAPDQEEDTRAEEDASSAED